MGTSAPAPGPTPGPSRAVLIIETFRAEVLEECWSAICVIPRIRLRETGGLSSAVVTSVDFAFEGDVGRAPTWRVERLVPAGHTLDLVGNDGYGHPDIELSDDSSHPGLSVIISFKDSEGRLGLVSGKVSWVEDGAR